MDQNDQYAQYYHRIPNGGRDKAVLASGSLSNSAHPRHQSAGQRSRELSAGGSENYQDQDGDRPATNGGAYGHEFPTNHLQIPGSSSSNGLMGKENPLNNR